MSGIHVDPTQQFIESTVWNDCIKCAPVYVVLISCMEVKFSFEKSSTGSQKIRKSMTEEHTAHGHTVLFKTDGSNHS